MAMACYYFYREAVQFHSTYVVELHNQKHTADDEAGQGPDDSGGSVEAKVQSAEQGCFKDIGALPGPSSSSWEHYWLMFINPAY